MFAAEAVPFHPRLGALKCHGADQASVNIFLNIFRYWWKLYWYCARKVVEIHNLVHKHWFSAWFPLHGAAKANDLVDKRRKLGVSVPGCIW